MRLDVITLTSYPEKYMVKLAQSYHDARSMARYVNAGGRKHPLTVRH